MAHLKLVPGAMTPAGEVKRRIRKTATVGMVQCHKCGGREVIESRSGVLLKDGKPTRGTKMLLCAACFMRGERVMLL